MKWLWTSNVNNPNNNGIVRYKDKEREATPLSLKRDLLGRRFPIYLGSCTRPFKLPWGY